MKYVCANCGHKVETHHALPSRERWCEECGGALLGIGESPPPVENPSRGDKNKPLPVKSPLSWTDRRVKIGVCVVPVLVIAVVAAWVYASRPRPPAINEMTAAGIFRSLEEDGWRFEKEKTVGGGKMVTYRHTSGECRLSAVIVVDPAGRLFMLSFRVSGPFRSGSEAFGAPARFCRRSAAALAEGVDNVIDRAIAAQEEKSLDHKGGVPRRHGTATMAAGWRVEAIEYLGANPEDKDCGFVYYLMTRME